MLTTIQMGSWFCTPCLYGRASQRLDIYPTNDTEQIDTCDTNCWLFCITANFGVWWVPMMIKRAAMREHLNIEGDMCRDAMVSFPNHSVSERKLTAESQVSMCCTPCGVAQMNTEMKDRAEKAMLLPQHGYQSHPQGMAYQQQPYPPPQPQQHYPQQQGY